MEKEEIIDYLYSVFNSKQNGVNEEHIDKMILKSIGMISIMYNVDIIDVEKKLGLGQKIEREHSKQDPQYQKIIALQHLVEDINYYINSKPKQWADIELKNEMVEFFIKKFHKLI